MAKLKLIDLTYIEKELGMGGGYVLGFSNNTFQRFIYDSLGFDVYDRYEYQSKAKLLRRIFDEFPDPQVGKLILELLEYKRAHLSGQIVDSNTFKKCVEIANRLMGKRQRVPKQQATAPSPEKPFDFQKNLKAIVDLGRIENSQRRGFAFEKFLYQFFLENSLEPRESFKIVGEQIDGSFTFLNEIYLLEAKWTTKPVGKSDLVNFNGKVSSKSGFTRGLFISFSGYSDEALESFSKGRIVNVVLMTVQEMAILLTREVDFRQCLKRTVRALAEEGEFYQDVMELVL